MFSPFPLLRLPRLILYEVFKSLSIGEKFKLSICSKKISTQINNDRLYSQKVIVDLDCLKQSIRVRSENDKETFEISIHPDYWNRHNSNTQHFVIACHTVRVISIRIGVKIMWKNHREGFLSVIRHLLKMFQCKITTKSSCCGIDLFQPTMYKLFDLKLEFKRLYIWFKGSKAENLLWNRISSNLGLVEYLGITSIPDPGFKPLLSSWPQIIRIKSSCWFTLEHLLTCTCQRITLEQSRLENKDLDVILKNWKAGGFPNLKHLTVHSIKNYVTPILGMNVRELSGTVIQNDDGSKNATIYINHPAGIEVLVTPFDET